MPRYTVILEPEEDEVGGYAVSVPALPGCFSQGRSVDEALAHIREAIALHLGALRRDGEPFPPDVTPILAPVEVEPADPGQIDAVLLAELDADELPAMSSRQI
jgi:antitoxin HicB